MRAHALGVMDVDRSISPHDRLYPLYVSMYGPEAYFDSGRRQIEELDGLMQRHVGRTLTGLRCAGEFACHYGRPVRWLRLRLPDATLLAYDIDPAAVEFCAVHYAAVPVRTDWTLAGPGPAPAVHELLICCSLLTHTDVQFARRARAAWRRMLAPHGLLVFTYLGVERARAWKAGEMPQYGDVPAMERARVTAGLIRQGHAFAGLPSRYSPPKQYGVGFLTDEVVAALVDEAGLTLYELVPTARNTFGQGLAVVTRPGGQG